LTGGDFVNSLEQGFVAAMAQLGNFIETKRLIVSAQGIVIITLYQTGVANEN
jgi:hypothetical protein